MNEEHRFNIRQIQRALRLLHKNGEDIPVVYEDGIFGAETERAVIAFQVQNNLTPSGTVDYETWTLLMEKSDEYIRRNAEALPIFPYRNDRENSAFPGEKGKAVLFLQAMLMAISEKYSGFDDVELTGINDAPTRKAIIRIHQCEKGEKCDGSLTRSTWNSVARLFNAI